VIDLSIVARPVTSRAAPPRLVSQRSVESGRNCAALFGRWVRLRRIAGTVTRRYLRAFTSNGRAGSTPVLAFRWFLAALRLVLQCSLPVGVCGRRREPSDSAIQGRVPDGDVLVVPPRAPSLEVLANARAGTF
jgi:hypothetical protein